MDNEKQQSGDPAVASQRIAEAIERLEPALGKWLATVTRERHSAGVWSLFKRGGIVLFFLLGLIVWGVVYGTAFGVQAQVIKPTVAQVEIQGPIGGSNDASAARLVPLLANLCKQAPVKGLVLHIDSPGGSPGDAERIGAQIDACKTMPLAKDAPPGTKPGRRRVVAVIDGLGASAAYMIALHADTIVANPTGLVGSIGVIIEGFKVDGLMKKVGVTSYAYASGPLKAMLSPYSEDTPAQQAVAQELTAQSAKVFEADVIAHRPHLVLGTPDLWSGRVWVAGQAKDIGLIDQIGLLEPVEAKDFPGLAVQVFRPQKTVRNFLNMDSWVGAVTARLMQQGPVQQ